MLLYHTVYYNATVSHGIFKHYSLYVFIYFELY